MGWSGLDREKLAEGLYQVLQSEHKECGSTYCRIPWVWLSAGSTKTYKHQHEAWCKIADVIIEYVERTALAIVEAQAHHEENQEADGQERGDAGDGAAIDEDAEELQDEQRVLRQEADAE